MTLVIDHR